MSDLKKILAVMFYDIKNMFSGGLVLAALAPVFVALLISASLPEELLGGGALQPVAVALVSGDDAIVSNMISGALDSISLISEVKLTDNAGEALEMLENGDVASVVSIPDGLIDAMIYNNPVSIDIWSGNGYDAENALIRGFADGIAKAVTAAQSAVYAFYDTAAPYYSDWNEFVAGYNDFTRKILMDVLQRGRFMEMNENPYDYAAQIISVVMFVTAAIAAALTAINTAEQLLDGSYTRMRLNGMKYGGYVLAKLAETVLAVLPLSASVLAVMYFTGNTNGLDMLKLFFCPVIFSVVFFGLFHCTAVICRSIHQTALSSFAILLLLMFIGGSFYPLYMLGGFLQVLGSHTPANICLLFVTMWAKDGGFPLEILVYAVIFAALTFVLRPKRGGGVYV